MVGFVMVMPLFLMVVLALLGLAMALHARMILVDSAAEGARAGSLSGAGPELAVYRTQELIAAALPAEYANAVRARELVVEGVAVIRVEVTAPMPLPGMPGTLEVRADAPLE